MIPLVCLGVERSAATGDARPGTVNSLPVVFWEGLLSGCGASRRTFLPELRSRAVFALASGFVTFFFIGTPPECFTSVGKVWDFPRERSGNSGMNSGKLVLRNVEECHFFGFVR